MLKLVYSLTTSLLPLLNLYVLKMLVDTVVNGCTGLPNADIAVGEQVLGAVLIFSGITLVNRIVATLAQVNNDALSQELIDYINDLIQRQSARLDMAYYDNPDYHDTFHRAQQEAAYRPIRMMEDTVTVIAAAVALVVVLIMLLSSSWQVVLVMLVAVVPSFAVRLWRSRRIYRFRRETTADNRRSSYLGTLLSHRGYAQEVRAFGLSDHLKERYVALRRAIVRRLMRLSRRLAVADTAAAIIEVSALGGAMLLMVRPVMLGAVTVGTFVMLFEAFRRAQGYLNNMVGGISGLYENKLFVSNLFEFMRLQPSIASPDNPVAFPTRVDEVLFDDVTFAYPDMLSPVLSGFSFRARRGQLAVIEGENGSGKSTMLKLLYRFYDPQGGSVRINGIDIRQFDVAELRQHISAVFQEHVHFFLSAHENVTLGDISVPEDAGRLQDALRLSMADVVVDKLPHGLDTQLGRQFAGGEELSMGQWQRLALARQLYKQAPILFFDEPSSWLDPTARRRLQQAIDALSKDHVVMLVRHREG